MADEWKAPEGTASNPGEQHAEFRDVLQLLS